MKLESLIFVMLLVGCGNRTSDSPSSKDFEQEDFSYFFEKFKSDTSFQIERVKFPFTIMTVDIDDTVETNKIDIGSWNHLGFDYKDEYATRQIDAYTQEAKIYSDSAKIELRGVDNGIYIVYVFTKVDGNWILTLERDYSN